MNSFTRGFVKINYKTLRQIDQVDTYHYFEEQPQTVARETRPKTSGTKIWRDQ